MARTDRCERCRDSAGPCASCHEAAESRARAAWEAYCRSSEKQTHAPERPDVVYQDAWRGWQEWLTWVGIPNHLDSPPGDWVDPLVEESQVHVKGDR
jgi:hypothetical protein